MKYWYLQQLVENTAETDFLFMQIESKQYFNF